MYTLILVTLSILLSAGTVVMTLYLSDQAYVSNAAHAAASTLLNQSQQLQLAARTFFDDKGRWPIDVPELVSSGYIRSTPHFVAEGTLHPWTTPVAGVPVYAQLEVPQDICEAVNRQLKVAGQLTLDETALFQCYGAPSEAPEFKMVSAVGPQELAAVHATVEGAALLD